VSFEVFDRQVAEQDAATPKISIQRSGSLSINRAAYRDLGEPEAVELLYDRERSLMGLRYANPAERTAYTVRMNTKGSTYLISAAAFLKHYGIDSSKARRWVATRQDKVLCVDISKRPDG
jgi:hypothetical protein